MPKIYLIKDRLHQQQQALLENHKRNEQVFSPNSLTQLSYQCHTCLMSPSQPLVKKETQLHSIFKQPSTSQTQLVQCKSPVKSLKNQNVPLKIKPLNNENNNHRINNSSSSGITLTESNEQCTSSYLSLVNWNLPPKKRFISTSCGDNILYGSKGNLQLTRVDNKGTVSLEAEPKLHPTPLLPPPEYHRVSVINIVPDQPLKQLSSMFQLPEQESPIDYRTSDLDLEIIQIMKNKYSITSWRHGVSESNDMNTVVPDRSSCGSTKFLGNESDCNGIIVDGNGIIQKNNDNLLKHTDLLLPSDERLIRSGINCYSVQHNNPYKMSINNQQCFNNHIGQYPVGCLADQHNNYREDQYSTQKANSENSMTNDSPQLTSSNSTVNFNTQFSSSSGLNNYSNTVLAPPIPNNEHLNVLRRRLSLPNDYPFEFINCGYGIKNPLAKINSTKKPKKDKKKTTAVPVTSGL